MPLAGFLQAPLHQCADCAAVGGFSKLLGMAFEVGTRFNSFAEFDRAFREFQLQNNVLFVAKATKTVDVVNSRLSVGLERLGKKLKYANATYVCKHGGERRCTATGVRPQQR